MNMFANMTTKGLEESGDRLGGGGVLDAGAYTGQVKLAYAGKSQSSNAQSVTVHIDIKGFEYRETFWVTNKNGENFYQDKKDPTKKQPLPGFTSIDDLCLLTTGFALSEQTVEEKVVSLYDFDQKKDIPQNVSVLTGVLGKDIDVGLIAQIVDKNVKDSQGNYVPSGETRTENLVDKFFHTESKRTVAEVRNGIATAEFYPKWVEKNAGKPPRNRAKGAQGKSGAPGGRPAPTAAAGGGVAAPAKSLFNS